jgi:hypothetical protein
MGSNRGLAAHDTLELLAAPKRKDLVNFLIKEGTCKTTPHLWRYVKARAKKYKVDDSDNLDMIDGFLITGLRSDFFGPKGTIHQFAEREFDIEIEGDGINCRIRGFIDRLFIYKIDGKLFIKVVDYKGSKKKHSEEELTTGQALMYQLALSFLYPEIELGEFKFIFLKFAKDPYQSYTPLSKSALNGYLQFLTSVQEYVNNFSEKNIGDNYGKLNKKMTFLCGPAKSGWICPHQNPMDYYVLLDKDRVITKSSFNDDLIPKEGETIEKRYYSGCSYFFNSKGERIRT